MAKVYQTIDEQSGEAVQRLLVDIARGGDVIAVKVDMELIAKDGSHLSVQDSAAPFKNAIGETTGVVVVFRNSSEQRENRRKIEAFNARLQQAMAETNHRIKNNLQMVAALVDLQAEEAGSLPADAVQKLSIHIKTLAHLHDFLTQEASRGEGVTNAVSARETLAKLVPLIQATVSERLVSFTSDAVRLPTKQSAALALVVNELISNALKHGMGKVELALRQENGTAILEVLDDGPGFPAKFNVASSAHNGLHLVSALTRTDLAGQIEYGNRAEGGGRVLVRFPISG